MFTKASNKIAEKLIFMQIVSNEDKEIYAYGINRVLTIVLNVAATLILGIIYGRVYEAALFFTAFILLRSYSGGYHASTPMKCYVFTVLLITTILSVMKFVSVHKYVCFGLSLLSDIIIILLSPNEAKNKPLDAIERIIYKNMNSYHEIVPVQYDGASTSKNYWGWIESSWVEAPDDYISCIKINFYGYKYNSYGNLIIIDRIDVND